MFGLTFRGGFYVFSLYPEYNYIFILIVIVLFSQTWNTISLSFKRKGQKWMLISGVLLSITAFGISRINLIDYKTINLNYLKRIFITITTLNCLNQKAIKELRKSL